MANCTICNKKIILVPSAKERSEQTGLPASYYTKLFTTHDKCFIEKREKETIELMRKLNNGLVVANIN